MALALKLRKQDSTPTKRITGTSLTSKPAIVPPRSLYNEQGSSRAAPLREIVPELANRNLQIRTYNKMVRGDVSVRISLRAGKAPVLAGDYYMEPFGENEIQVQIAEFCETCLFHMPSMPWLMLLSNILHMFKDGNSIFEPVYGLREWAPKKTSPGANRKQYTMLNKINYRPASSIVKINYDDNGGPLNVEHKAVRADNRVEDVTIPIENLLIFAFEGDGGSLDGESLLRTAYEPWYYKHNFYKIDGVQKERHGIGIPDIQLQPGYTPADKAVAHELGRNLRTNEYAYIVRPPNVEVGFAELHGNVVDALASATHHDLQIMKNVLIQFLEVDVAGGGRATAATSADIFLKAMRYIGSYICEVFNRFLIPNLVAYNFETDEFPQMKVRNIGEVKDLQMWAAAMGALVDKNILTMDDESEDFVRDVIQWPHRLTPRPISTEGPSNVKQQYLLRDNPDTSVNEDLAGQAAVTKAAQPTGPTGPSGANGTGGGGTGTRTGNINKSTLSGA